MVLLLVSGSVPAARAGEAAGSWHVTQISGSARLRHGLEGWQNITQGLAIAPGTTIETGADGRAVLTSGKDVVTVAPSSRVAVPADRQAGKGADFLQTLGTLLFDIEHNPARHFEVDTPYLAAVVKGTAFTVTVRPDGGAVQVTRGAVQVASSLAPDIALVRPGQIARVPAVRGSRMTITDRGHTAIVPRTGKSKAELTEPDPTPAAGGAGDHAPQTASSDAAPPSGADARRSATAAAASAPHAAAMPATPSRDAAAGADETPALDHAIALPTSGLSAGSTQSVVITRTLGPQMVDVTQVTNGFVEAGAAAIPAAAVGMPQDSGAASKDRQNGANEQTGQRVPPGAAGDGASAFADPVPTSAAADNHAPVEGDATPAAGNPGHGGTPQGQAVGNPHVAASAETSPAVVVTNSAPPVTTAATDAAAVASAPATPAAGNPGHGGTPQGQAAGNPHVTTPAVTTPAATTPAATTPAIVVSDTASVAPAPVASPVANPGHGGTPQGQAAGNPHVTAPTVTTPAATTPAIVVSDTASVAPAPVAPPVANPGHGGTPQGQAAGNPHVTAPAVSPAGPRRPSPPRP